MKKSKTFRIYEEDEAIIIERLVSEVKRTGKPQSKIGILSKIIKESNK